MRVTLILVALCVLAGCATPAPSTTLPQSDASIEQAPTPPTSRVLAPEWRVGDWWKWRIETTNGPPFEVTSIVTAEDESAYTVGVDDLPLALKGMANHVLVTGIVKKENLAWETHDQPAVVLSFPLGDGATWQGEEEGRQLTFTANATAEGFDVVGVTENGRGVVLHYSPAAKHFSKFELWYEGDEPYGTATLIDRGAGSAARAVSFTTDDLFATFAGGPEPDPRATFDVPAGVDLVYVACAAGGPGVARAEFAAPSGAAFSCGGEGYSSALAPGAQGAWLVRALAAGGYIEAEVYGVRLAG